MSQPLSSETQRELQSLVDSQLDGHLTPDQSSRLNELLQDDAAADFFVRYSNLHADLSWMRRGADVSETIERDLQALVDEPGVIREDDFPRRKRSTWMRLAVAVATAACLLFAVGNFLPWQPGTSPGPNTRGGARGWQAPKHSQAWDSESLTGLQLTVVGDESITWKFDASSVEIFASAGVLPPEFCMELGLATSPRAVTASWELVDRNRFLRLFDLNTGDDEIESEIRLPIRRAGILRTNLGSRQYNQQR